MGQEIKCRVEFGKEASDGKALLESAEVLFRGDFRLKIPFHSITSMDAANGKLKIQFGEGAAVFHLGTAAEKWADKIRNPPSRLDKLGIKAGTKVQLINKHDEAFKRELAERGAPVVKSNADLVFLSVKNKDELVEMAYLTKENPVWVVYPKGIQAVTENDVIKAGRSVGYSDIKVVAFSATHTALKFKPRDR
ncbi:MAG TPA: hypothetical protein VKT81_18790 [Bryobacteraceae bacterium]|nr:hypothetical protein [Bryobacteraceae bacterium]